VLLTIAGTYTKKFRGGGLQNIAIQILPQHNKLIFTSLYSKLFREWGGEPQNPPV
jgi:hypothetical protein